MKEFIENYYRFLTDGKGDFSTYPKVYKDENDDSPRVYIWQNDDVWIFNSKDDDLQYTQGKNSYIIDDILADNPEFKLSESAYFNIFPNKELDINLADGYSIVKITESDKELFDEFLSKCSQADKEQGQVSCDDDLVYASVYNGKIVSASSLWHWGDEIADIGVLTIEEHRKKGLVKACLNAINNETSRTILWRSASDNMSSINAAKVIGFIRVGSVYKFVKSDK